MSQRASQLLKHLESASHDADTALSTNPATQHIDHTRPVVGVILGKDLLAFLQKEHDGLLHRIEPIVIDFKGQPVDPSQASAMSTALVFARPDGSNAQTAERVLTAAKSLMWFHSPSAGVDFLLKSPIVSGGAIAPAGHVTMDSLRDERGFVLTNTPGGTAVPIAEFVLMYMLFWVKRVAELRGISLPSSQTGKGDDANGKNWWRQANLGLANKMGGLHGATVVIWGFGAIGQEVGKRCRAFGMKVVGTRRNLNPAGILDGSYDELAGEDAWQAHLGHADFFVICAPLTAATRNMVNKTLLGKMKKGCYIINIARGAIINDADLCDAINSGHISGAALVGCSLG